MNDSQESTLGELIGSSQVGSSMIWEVFLEDRFLERVPTLSCEEHIEDLAPLDDGIFVSLSLPVQTVRSLLRRETQDPQRLAETVAFGRNVARKGRSLEEFAQLCPDCRTERMSLCRSCSQAEVSAQVDEALRIVRQTIGTVEEIGVKIERARAEGRAEARDGASVGLEAIED